MIKVGKLTDNEAELIFGKRYNDDSFFNPILDADGNFIISVEEIRDTVVEEFMWVKSLPLMEYKPIEYALD